jgi:hypothetical protein
MFELACRKIMVTELAKYHLFIRFIDLSDENIYRKLCELQDEWIHKQINPDMKRMMLDAFRAAIHEQLNRMENA